MAGGSWLQKNDLLDALHSFAGVSLAQEKLEVFLQHALLPVDNLPGVYSKLPPYEI